MSLTRNRFLAVLTASIAESELFRSGICFFLCLCPSVCPIGYVLKLTHQAAAWT